MAAGEDQLEAFVGKRRCLVGSSSHVASGTSSSSVCAASVRSRRMRSIARLRAVTISHAAGVRGRPVARPAFGGDRERLLGGLLGEVEVAEEADQGGEHAPPLLAEDLLDQRATSGRTSTAPPSRAAGIRAANSIAASRSSASSR